MNGAFSAIRRTGCGNSRVVASTDCGFGTFAVYGRIDPAVTWAKLAALREGADRADAAA